MRWAHCPNPADDGIRCSIRAIAAGVVLRADVHRCVLLYHQAKELLRVRNYVNNVLAHATGQPVEKIQHDFNRNK